MRIRSYNRFSNNSNMVFADYNLKLKHKRTRIQWFIRIFIILCFVSFFGGVLAEFNNLTGLNSRSIVVSAHEAPKQFNPVKILLSDEGAKMTEVDYILVGNLMRVRMAIKQLEECAVHSNEIAEYGLTKEEVIKVLDKLRAMDSQIYRKVEERWSNEISTEN